MLYLILYVAVHLVCAFFTFGITVGYFQRKFPLCHKEQYRGDLMMGILYGLYGPIGLVASYFLSERAKYGLKWRPSE